jgi:hypothetical protein
LGQRVKAFDARLKAFDAPAQDAPAACDGASNVLGNNTLSRAGFFEVLDEKTGEIQRLRRSDKCNELVLETPQEFDAQRRQRPGRNESRDPPM